MAGAGPGRLASRVRSPNVPRSGRGRPPHAGREPGKLVSLLLRGPTGAALGPGNERSPHPALGAGTEREPRTPDGRRYSLRAEPIAHGTCGSVGCPPSAPL